MATKYKEYIWWKTALLSLHYACSGIAWSIVGPTIPDLCQRMNITAEQIGFAMSLSSFSWMAGTILFSILLDRFVRQYELFIFAALISLGSSLIIMPLTTQLWVYTLCSVVKGLVDSVIELVCNAMTLTLWGKEADGPLFLVHFFWTIGSAVTPFFVRPFLGESQEMTVNNTTLNISITSENATDTSQNVSGSRIEIPYLIGGVICIIAGLLSLGTHIVGPPKGFKISRQERKSFKQIFSLGKLTETSSSFAIPMCLLLFVFYFLMNGAWSTAFYWMYSYAIESDLPFTPKEASTLDAANKFVYSLGHIVFEVLLKAFSIQKLFFGSAVLTTIIALALAIVGTRSKVLLYIISCAYWIPLTGLWAGCLAFLDKYLVVTATVLLFANLGASSSGFLFSWLAGWIFTNHNPDYIFWLMFCCLVADCIIIAIMFVMVLRQGSRFDEVYVNENKNVEVDAEGTSAPLQANGNKEKCSRI